MIHCSILFLLIFIYQINALPERYNTSSEILNGLIYSQYGLPYDQYFRNYPLGGSEIKESLFGINFTAIGTPLTQEFWNVFYRFSSATAYIRFTSNDEFTLQNINQFEIEYFDFDTFVFANVWTKVDRANSNRLTRSLTTMSGTVEESQSNFSGQNGIIRLVNDSSFVQLTTTPFVVNSQSRSMAAVVSARLVSSSLNATQLSRLVVAASVGVGFLDNGVYRHVASSRALRLSAARRLLSSVTLPLTTPYAKQQRSDVIYARDFETHASTLVAALAARDDNIDLAPLSMTPLENAIYNQYGPPYHQGTESAPFGKDEVTNLRAPGLCCPSPDPLVWNKPAFYGKYLCYALLSFDVEDAYTRNNIDAFEIQIKDFRSFWRDTNGEWTEYFSSGYYGFHSPSWQFTRTPDVNFNRPQFTHLHPDGTYRTQAIMRGQQLPSATAVGTYVLARLVRKGRSSVDLARVRVHTHINMQLSNVSEPGVQGYPSIGESRYQLLTTEFKLFSFFSLPLTAPQYGQTAMEPIVKSFDELKPIFDQVNLDELDSATTSVESQETTPSTSKTATTTSNSETSTKSIDTPTSATTPSSNIVTQTTPSLSTIINSNTPSSFFSTTINSNTRSSSSSSLINSNPSNSRTIDASSATNSVQATFKSPTPTTTLNTRSTLAELSTPTTMTIAANVPGSIDDNSSIESFPLWLILILGGILCCIVLIVGIVCWLKKRHADHTAVHDPNPDDYIETDLDDKSDITEDESVYHHSTDGIYAVVPDVNNDAIIYDVVTS
mmetsp:Transcript_22629/g.38374  ORF Transcript_22629/g.38374 Transcript_22629/m.38374 type:complete len:778 (-) Transcript_22629:92-2425(-)